MARADLLEGCLGANLELQESLVQMREALESDISQVSNQIIRLQASMEEKTPTCVRDGAKEQHWTGAEFMSEASKTALLRRDIAAAAAAPSLEESNEFSTRPWTPADDEALLAAAEQHKEHDWEAIAAHIGQRTAVECLVRYQRAINSALVRVAWTAEEDALLRELATTHGDGHGLWRICSSLLEGRSATQCRIRWTKTLCPGVKKGKWDETEERLLYAASRAYLGSKGQWSMIQRHVPMRTGTKCREKWVHVLDPELNLKPWRSEEDAILRQGISEFGSTRWAEIARRLPGRSGQMCSARWRNFLQQRTGDGGLLAEAQTQDAQAQPGPSASSSSSST
uniref:Uncharacterized protein n=1 Tax=Rhizochromulina marina TaxID=1034831 RepID=A0A7S2SJY2_9STRA|mmetsp:Transcript_30463/g.88521  ORF Transcript_30463/g.88521 Transcript_30463/m.88521 type:complete len:339 (+) Transcript_30463:43-1059(+)